MLVQISLELLCRIRLLTNKCLYSGVDAC